MEQCPLPEHSPSRVTKNGRYGKPGHERQMFRCHRDSEAAHNFAGLVPRFVTEAATCEHCETEVEPHEGPWVASHYGFPVAQAAAALVMVGQGVSYTETADRMRVRNHRGSQGGAEMVANWVEALGPVVCAPRAKRAWPATVVLDDTWFMVTKTATGVTSSAFHVLGAYGYPQGGDGGRLWVLWATAEATGADWEAFCQSLRGQPQLVVCDNDTAIHSGAANAWPGAVVKLCEHHLHKTAKKKLRQGEPAAVRSQHARHGTAL